MYNDYYGNYGNPFIYAQATPYGMQQNTATMPQSAADNIFTYPQNLNNALTLIQQAVTGENEDRLFYTWLIENAPSGEDKQVITGILDNEVNHFQMFRKIFYDLTGRMIPQTQDEEFTPPATYCEGLKKALMGEQNAVQKYRKILYAMQSRVHINMLTEIITDEIRHGILYNYLYAKNNCKA